MLSKIEAPYSKVATFLGSWSLPNNLAICSLSTSEAHNSSSLLSFYLCAGVTNSSSDSLSIIFSLTGGVLLRKDGDCEMNLECYLNKSMFGRVKMGNILYERLIVNILY